jgi:hypothetical protein
MATEKKTPETEAPKAPERVELHIPRGAANDEPNLFISINGKNYLLPKGKTSMVPPEVAAEYHRSVKAQEKLDARMDALLNSQK